MLRIDARIGYQQRVQLAAHIIHSSTVLILLVDVLLVRKQKIQEPGMELLMEQEDMPILSVPLSQHVEVKQSTLPQEIIGLGNKVHEELESGRVLDLVIIINHQLGIQGRHWPAQNPL